MSMTHKEWLTSWANRWVGDAKAELQRRHQQISELQQALAGASDEDQRDYFESLIEQHENIIESIRLSHRQWRRRAKRCYGLDMPELAE